MKDAWHRTVAPSTYPCNLCALTYGKLGVKEEWKDFVEQLEIPSRFLHRDEFLREFNKEHAEYPAVFLKRGNTISQFIFNREINDCQTLKQLVGFVRDRMHTL